MVTKERCTICGIYAGWISPKDMVDGLNKLSFRGADSKGLGNHNCVYRTLSPDIRYSDVAEKLFGSGPLLGHSRWSSSGKVSLENCHPIKSKFGEILLVHNGTLTGYEETETRLSKLNNKSYVGKTDTEVLADFIEDIYIRHDKLFDEWKNEIDGAFGGTYAIAFLIADSPNLYWMTKDVPLYYYEGRLSSEASLLPAYFSLPNNSWGRISKEAPFVSSGGVAHHNIYYLYIDGVHRVLPSYTIPELVKNESIVTEGDYMLKEIKEQATLSYNYLEQSDGVFDTSEFHAEDFEVIGCGSSYHAALLGQKYLEDSNSYSNVRVCYSSEYVGTRGWNGPVIAITQSGETADTLEILRNWNLGELEPTLIVNRENSTASQLSTQVFKMNAGPEIAVAATKSFTATCMLLLAMFRPKLYKSLDLDKFRVNISKCIELLPQIQDIAANISEGYENYTVFGSGFNYPIALETALKLQETARINCQGLVSELWKHGFISICNETFLGITFIPDKTEPKYERVLNSVKQTKARNGFSLGIGPSKVDLCDWFIKTPKDELVLQPLLNNVVGQLLAYSIGKYRGYSIDQIENCAKAITVH